MDKKLVLLISIFFVTFGTFISLVIIKSNPNNSPLTKAQQNQNVDVNNSMIFSVPSDKGGCDITVVINDSKKVPIRNIEVCFETTNGILNNQCKNTNDSGIATVQLRELDDNSKISAVINNQQLPNTVNCFYSYNP